MKKRWLALILVGMMFVTPVLGMAEGQAAFDASQVAPLLDAVTSAVMAEEVTNLSEAEPLTEALLARLMKALRDKGLDVNGNSLSNLIAMPFPENGLNAEAAVQLLSLQVIHAQVNETGDTVMLVGEIADADGEPVGPRAVAELRKEAASPVGWKLYRFTMVDVALEEELLEGYFNQTMIEYVNAICGYSIQYPAIFAEDQIVETTGGIQAELSDGTASFSVARVENVGGLPMDAILTQETQNVPGTKVAVDEVTGAGRSILIDEEGIAHEAIFLVTEAYVYQAELNYPVDQAEDFAMYVEYMMNSFTVDELGLG